MAPKSRTVALIAVVSVVLLGIVWSSSGTLPTGAEGPLEPGFSRSSSAPAVATAVSTPPNPPPASPPAVPPTTVDPPTAPAATTPAATTLPAEETPTTTEAPKPQSLVSGVTGAVFRATRIRTAPKYAALPDTPSKLLSLTPNAPKCRIWGALTTIHGPPPSVTSLLERGACVVVVGDAKTDDAPWKAWAAANSSLIYLSLADQRGLDLHVVKHLPDNHFGKKNVAYLYAAAQGAEWIFDFDDDNDYVQSDFEAALKGPITFELQPPMDNKKKYSVHNPLPLFRPVSKGKAVSRMWPRGLPLDEVKQVQVTRNVNRDVKVGLVQCLADGDPDVDAIFRLTSDIPVTFSEPKMRVLLPMNGYSPLNAQATWIHQSMAHMMLLPISVHGRVSDIWRSYILERAAYASGQQIVIHNACVVQDRNVHSYLRDYMAERPLYEQAGEFIRVLAEATNEDLEQDPLQSLYATLYEHGFIEESDLKLAHAWMSDLSRLGIKSGVSKEVRSTTPAVAPKTTTPPPSAICYFGEPRSLPRTVDSLRKHVHEVFDVEAFAEFPKTKLPMDDLAQMGPWGGLRLDTDDDIPKWLTANNIDIDILTANGTRKEDWLSGLTLGGGGAVFIWKSLNECLSMIQAREAERGSKFETVLFSRTDLYFPRASPRPTLKPNQCWIPCPCNDYTGYCDHYAICGRDAATAYADVLGALRNRIKTAGPGSKAFDQPAWLPQLQNSESFMKRRLEAGNVEVLRGPDVFIRACQCDAYASSCQPHLRPPFCRYSAQHKIWFRDTEVCPLNGNLPDAALHEPTFTAAPQPTTIAAA